MQNNSSLLDLFIPPEGYFGDFGMLCGFTATRTVLQQIKAKFSGDTSRPVLAAFIHPTVNAISDVAGLTWIWMNPKQNDRGYALLHAKVALLQKFDTFFQKRFLPQPSLPINSSTCEGFQTEP